MLPTHTGTLIADDGTPLAWQVWEPDHRPQATVVFLHGGAEHGRRYPRLITALVAHGWAVVAPDLRGHGRSGGRRGGLKRFSDYLDDLATFVDLACRRGGGVPLFLAGYSLGGLISASYSLTRAADGELAGLVLIAPALGPGDKAPTAVFTVARAVSAIVPWLPVFKMPVDSMMSDPAVLAAYKADPLVHHGFFTARLIGEFTAVMRGLPDQLSKLGTPLLVVHGEADVTAHPQRSRDLVGAATVIDKTLLTYPRMRHDVCNEPGGEQTVTDITRWVAARVCCDPERSGQV